MNVLKMNNNILLKLQRFLFSNIQLRTRIIDKYATVTVDKNRYSVPTKYAGCKATVLLGANHINIFTFGKKIAIHKRDYNTKQWCIDPDHYLELIKQKPSSFASPRVIQQWSKKWPKSLILMLDKIRSRYGQGKGTKDFVSLLMLYRNYTSSEIKAVVELALEVGVADSSGVKHILLFTSNKVKKEKSLSSWQTLPVPDTSVYAQLDSIK